MSIENAGMEKNAQTLFYLEETESIDRLIRSTETETVIKNSQTKSGASILLTILSNHVFWAPSKYYEREWVEKT